MSEQTQQQTQQEQDTRRGVVIVGAGMAGVQTAVALREQGWTGPVTLLGAEPHQPYDRPPLSKAVLLGKAEDSAFDVDFEELGIELRLGVEVTGLRAADREVDTEAGPVPYEYLVLATGALPLTLPGAEGVPGVHLLRTLDDAARLRPVLAAGSAVVVVGAGWIGAEFATAAREAGCAVTVVEAAGRVLAGALPAEVAEPMGRWYARAGAELLTDARVASVEPGRVLLADGRELPAEAVVVGIGARPATGWLAGSGVELGPDGAVTADEWLRTSVPGVYAVGDCASFPSARYGSRLLVHHWDNALQGPRVVAADILAGGSGSRSTTRSRTSGRSSSVASCSTPATTPTRTHRCGAATRRPTPGRCAGCGKAGWSRSSRWAARATWPRGAASSSRAPWSTRRRSRTRRPH